MKEKDDEPARREREESGREVDDGRVIRAAPLIPLDDDEIESTKESRTYFSNGSSSSSCFVFFRRFDVRNKNESGGSIEWTSKSNPSSSFCSNRLKSANEWCEESLKDERAKGTIERESNLAKLNQNNPKYPKKYTQKVDRMRYL